MIGKFIMVVHLFIAFFGSTTYAMVPEVPGRIQSPTPRVGMVPVNMLRALEDSDHMPKVTIDQFEREPDFIKLLKKRSRNEQLSRLSLDDRANLQVWLAHRGKETVLKSLLASENLFSILKTSTSPESRFNLGYLFEKQQEYDKALEQYTKSQCPQGRYAAGRLLLQTANNDKHQLQEALIQFKTAAADMPAAFAGAAKAAYHIAQSSENPEDRVAYAREALHLAAQAPAQYEDATLAYMKGKLHLILGDKQSGVNYLRTVLTDADFGPFAQRLIDGLQPQKPAEMSRPVAVLAQSSEITSGDLEDLIDVADVITKNSPKKQQRQFVAKLADVVMDDSLTSADGSKLRALAAKKKDIIGACMGDRELGHLCEQLSGFDESSNVALDLFLTRLNDIIGKDTLKKEGDRARSLLLSDSFKRMKEDMVNRSTAQRLDRLSFLFSSYALPGISYEDVVLLQQANEMYQLLAKEIPADQMAPGAKQLYVRSNKKLAFIYHRAHDERALPVMKNVLKYDASAANGMLFSRTAIEYVKNDIFKGSRQKCTKLISKAYTVLKDAAQTLEGIDRLSALSGLLELQLEGLKSPTHGVVFAKNCDQAAVYARQILTDESLEVRQEDQLIKQKALERAYKALIYYAAAHNDTEEFLKYAHRTVGNQLDPFDKICSYDIKDEALLTAFFNHYYHQDVSSDNENGKKKKALAAIHLAEILVRKDVPPREVIVKYLQAAADLIEKTKFTCANPVQNMPMYRWLKKELAEIMQKSSDQLTNDDMVICRIFTDFKVFESDGTQEKEVSVEAERAHAFFFAVKHNDPISCVEFLKLCQLSTLWESSFFIERTIDAILGAKGIHRDLTPEQRQNKLDVFSTNILALRFQSPDNEQVSSSIPLVHFLRAYAVAGRLDEFMSKLRETDYIKNLSVQEEIKLEDISLFQSAVDIVQKYAQSPELNHEQRMFIETTAHILKHNSFNNPKGPSTEDLTQFVHDMDQTVQVASLELFEKNFIRLYLERRFELARDLHVDANLNHKAGVMKEKRYSITKDPAHRADTLYNDIVNRIATIKATPEYCSIILQMQAYNALLAKTHNLATTEHEKKIVNQRITEAERSKLFQNDKYFWELNAYAQFASKEFKQCRASLDRLRHLDVDPVLITYNELDQIQNALKERIKKKIKGR